MNVPFVKYWVAGDFEQYFFLKSNKNIRWRHSKRTTHIKSVNLLVHCISSSHNPAYVPGPTFGFVKLLASSGSHCTKWADEQHRPAGFESRLVPDLLPTLIGLRAFDLVSSPVWWEAATNLLLKLNCIHMVAMCISLKKTFSGTGRRSKWLRYRISTLMVMISSKGTLAYKLIEQKNELLQSTGIFWIWFGKVNESLIQFCSL